MSEVTNDVLANKIDNLHALILKHITDDEAKFETMGEALNGNGKPGLKTNVEILMQESVSRKKHFLALWVAMLGLVSAWLKGHF